jgi:hypothetical protein
LNGAFGINIDEKEISEMKELIKKQTISEFHYFDLWSINLWE